MFKDSITGALYFGEMRIGDSLALPDEVARYESNAKTAAMDAYKAEFRAKRELTLNRITGIALAAQEALDVEMVAAVLVARQTLLDMPGHASVTTATDLTTLKTAFATRYALMVYAMPTALKTAFGKVDA